MAARIIISTPDEYQSILVYKLTNQLPGFETTSQRQTFLRKCEKLIIINNRIFVDMRPNPLEYI